MTETINKIPAETRWEIATKGLTGAITAVDKALKDDIGENKYNFTFSLTKNMVRGDSCCEWVIERKK
jgi:hypothetical protein